MRGSRQPRANGASASHECCRGYARLRVTSPPPRSSSSFVVSRCSRSVVLAALWGAPRSSGTAARRRRRRRSSSSPVPFTGQLVSFDVGLAMGAQVDLLPSSKAAGLSATALRRGGVVTVASNHAMNASDWPSGAVDVAKHFTFSVTPPPGCALTASRGRSRSRARSYRSDRSDVPHRERELSPRARRGVTLVVHRGER